MNIVMTKVITLKQKRKTILIWKQILRSVRRIMRKKARKDLMKGPQMKNPHFESTEDAYVSQEEVSEESTEEIAETETFLTFGQYQHMH